MVTVCVVIVRVVTVLVCGPPERAREVVPRGRVGAAQAGHGAVHDAAQEVWKM